MKGLILSGGKGSRLYPLTYTRAKQLVPVANKPVLFRVIETLRDAGVTDIGIVVGHTGPEIREAVGQGRSFGVQVSYIEQDAPKGLAHAVKVARDFLADERFVMFLGDNVIEGGIGKLISEFRDHSYNAQVVLKKVEQPQAYGVAVLSDEPERRIVRLVEKPRTPPSNLALVGIYMFDRAIHQAVDEISPSWRGELEITDAIQWLVDHGYEVHPHIHHGWWIDTGKTTDMLAANAKVLEELTPRLEGYVDRDSQVDERVTLQEGSEVINSVVRGPAIIGRNTRLVNAYIGPFTSIYHDCLIESAEIEQSIVLEHSTIVDIPYRIADSLIGRNVEVTRSEFRPKALKMTLGDNSRVGIL